MKPRLKMDKRAKLRRIAIIVVGAVAVSMVGAFAIVSNQPGQSQIAGGSLDDVIKSRETWDVAFPEWSGKTAPDFTVTDVHGVEHKLSDYQGRNVLLVFWATWCPACNVEIPHLIGLRKEHKKDDLAILALSNETARHLKSFGETKGINYSVVPLGSSVLPQPYADVRSIPTSFFIDKNGTIKLAAVGLVSLEDSRAILRAGQQELPR
jgi:peroxiredoxin